MGVVGAALRGFGRALKKAKTGKTISSVKPLTKIKGSKSVDEHKISASAARIKQGSFEFKEGVNKAMNKMKKID